MTQCLSRSDKNKATKKLKSLRDWQNEIQEHLDPPKRLNGALGLFFGGFFHVFFVLHIEFRARTR